MGSSPEEREFSETRFGRTQRSGLGEFGSGVGRVAFVIAAVVVVMALVRFQPKAGGWVLLAITLLLLRNLFEGGSAL